MLFASYLAALLVLVCWLGSSGCNTAGSGSCNCGDASAGKQSGRIMPSSVNPRYWQYKGQTVLLLGGSEADNLFQIPNLQQHLDLLASVGGNYIRNTMSDRPDHGYEIKAFKKLADGKYDLDQFNDEYWQRFENMLRLTREREIIVQIEVWDRFDHSREPWQQDPFNPDNNINYSCSESGLASEYPDHPGRNAQPFFFSVPQMDNNELLLKYQQKFVDKMLSYSLKYDNVLYCMDNETAADPRWGEYWACYIRDKAIAAGVEVMLTEMWDKWDVRDKMHLATFDHPQLYGFVDISQNSQTPGKPNWDNAQWVRDYIAAHRRPMNSTKIYGSPTCPWGDRGIDQQHATNSFWRNILGGFASSRFHRPPAGLALGEVAQANIRSARMLQEKIDIFSCKPDSDLKRLIDCEENQAYLRYQSGKQYVVFFCDGGSVKLDLSNADAEFTLSWLDIDSSSWQEESSVTGGEIIELTTPAAGQWAAVLVAK